MNLSEHGIINLIGAVIKRAIIDSHPDVWVKIVNSKPGAIAHKQKDPADDQEYVLNAEAQRALHDYYDAKFFLSDLYQRHPFAVKRIEQRWETPKDLLEAALRNQPTAGPQLPHRQGDDDADED